jgi:uncharacterized membrane protein YccC
MNKSFLVSGALIGGAAAVGVLTRSRPEARRRLATKARERFASHMEHMLNRMPEGSPPRLIMTTLPRLAEQNDEILALLHDHDTRLRRLGASVEEGQAV